MPAGVKKTKSPHAGGLSAVSSRADVYGKGTFK